ncbi:MAG: biosynthetic arginine decarboxylase [Legionellales bacterium]|nr:biosynthetic arginine decarboxylase [Legionellales bacterium]
MAIVQDIKKHFNIDEWGDGFFDIDSNGDLLVNITEDKSLSLVDIVSMAKKLKIQLPCLVQFPDILRNRVNQLISSFDKAIQNTNYEGSYIPVYPIKVNQKKNVVKTLFNSNGNIGLESGSKAEFLAILSIARPGKAILICNGYKDEEYIKMALIGTALGHKIFIVIEKLSELSLVLKLYKEMKIIPNLGIRARLSTIDCAKGQNYSGERAKFGLSSSQILDAINLLKEFELLNSLQMLHFHMGTQLSNIRNIYQGLQEGGRIYVSLKKLNVNLNLINVGGGLAVDYEGTKSRSLNSKNYGLYEYAYHIVHTLKECCLQHEITMPDIVTEAGRSMTAHHSVLLCEVIDTEEYIPKTDISYKIENKHISILELEEILRDISKKSLVEAYHDTIYWQEEVNHLFNMGILSLQEKSFADSLVLNITTEILSKLDPSLQAHRGIYDVLVNSLSNKLYGNFSIFRSIPDVWAIDQIFPIIPIQGLNETPKAKFILADITCDSDGTFNYYINGQSVERSVALPSNVGKNSILGIFLVGAYQDILGDNHNLFGKTNEIVVVNLDGKICIQPGAKGDTIADVLTEVRYDKSELLNEIYTQIESIISDNKKQELYKQFFVNSVDGYTYLVD